MVDEERPDPPPENKTKEEWLDSFDIKVTVSITSRLYKKYTWNEERIHRIGGINYCQICKDVVRFV